jgi:hypothetical protein
MARLCVRIADNAHPTDPKLTPLRTQPGDVVCVVEDDHQFSKSELSNGQYLIVDVPGVPEPQLAYLTGSTFDKDGFLVAKRAKALDVPALKNAGTTDKDGILTATPVDIQATTITKPVPVVGADVALGK